MFTCTVPIEVQGFTENFLAGQDFSFAYLILGVGKRKFLPLQPLLQFSAHQRQ